MQLPTNLGTLLNTLQFTGQPHTIKNYLGQNINSAESEDDWAEEENSL